MYVVDAYYLGVDVFTDLVSASVFVYIQSGKFMYMYSVSMDWYFNMIYKEKIFLNLAITTSTSHSKGVLLFTQTIPPFNRLPIAHS